MAFDLYVNVISQSDCNLVVSEQLRSAVIMGRNECVLHVRDMNCCGHFPKIGTASFLALHVFFRTLPLFHQAMESISHFPLEFRWA